MPKQLRVKGHELLFEGYPFDIDEWRLPRTSGPGYGKCSCGSLSSFLPTTAARQRWHRSHKEEVLRKQSQ